MNDSGEKITFHDEEVVPEKKGPVSKKAMTAFIGSLVYLLIQVIVLIFGNGDEVSTFISIIDIIGIIIFFASIIVGAMSLKEIKKKSLSGKHFAILGIVLPIVFFIVIMILTIVLHGDEFKEGFSTGFYCPSASECVDNGDKTSTCVKEDGEEIVCPNELLNSGQYK